MWVQKLLQLSSLKTLSLCMVLFSLLQWSYATSLVEARSVVKRNHIQSRSMQDNSSSISNCMTADFNCNSSYPSCTNPSGFVFNDVYDILERYWGQCGADGALLYRQPGTQTAITENFATFSNAACEAMAGAKWVMYPVAQIWDRVTVWKFPLFQLIAVSPMAPLGFMVGGFIVVHLLGDPISSLTNLLRTLDNCQSRADDWEHELNNDLKTLVHGRSESFRQQLLRALTLIVVSYDELGLGDAAKCYLQKELILLCSRSASSTSRIRFVTICLETGAHLAADRSTKFLPVVIAQAFFVSGVILAIVRTKSLAEGPNPQTYIDIETYSIGFTALFFWLIPYVTLSSVIGASQTAKSIPDHLRDFRGKMVQHFPGRDLGLPSVNPDDEGHQRRIYSYHLTEDFRGLFHNASSHVRRLLHAHTPRHRRPSIHEVRFHRTWPWVGTIIPLFTVSFAAFTGLLLTWLVPPIGWSCRSDAEFAMFATWVVNYLFSFIPCSNHFRITFVRDFLAMGITLGLVVATQVGVFNKCSCYTLDGRVGLQLPEIPIIKQMLQHRLILHYPAITAMGIIVQLIVIPGIIWLRYSAAINVFLQRDDGRNNLHWLCNTISRARRGRQRTVGTEVGEDNSEQDALMDDGEARVSDQSVKEDEAKGASVHVEEVALNAPQVVLQTPEQAFYAFRNWNSSIGQAL